MDEKKTVTSLLLVSGWREARRGRWWGVEGVRLLAHEAHQWRLCRGKWLCHQGLWRPRWKWRSRCGRLAELPERLAGSSACSRCSCTVGVVAAAAGAVILVLIGRGVETAPVISTPVGGGGGGRAVSVSAVAAVAVEAAASVFGAATSAHAAVTLILVHKVRVVGVASTVTHPTSWCTQVYTSTSKSMQNLT